MPPWNDTTNFKHGDSEVSNPNSTNKNILVGWVDESSGRGTWTIISTCLFTILLCTWTAIHPRVHTTRRLFTTHKMCQLFKTIMAPEMVCVEALQEWVQARKVVKRAKAATEGRLKLVHAFYVGMLGLRYRTQYGYRVLWPGQYIWLLNQGLISWNESDSWGLCEESIRDKSKADGLVKLAALCQVSWFVLQCITRAAHDLPICPLETMTLAYVFVVITTYLFWWLKPKDITTASFITLPEMRPDQWEVFEELVMENTYDYDNRNEEKSMNIAWYLVSRDCNPREEDILTSSMTQAPNAAPSRETTNASVLEGRNPSPPPSPSSSLPPTITRSSIKQTQSLVTINSTVPTSPSPISSDFLEDIHPTTTTPTPTIAIQRPPSIPSSKLITQWDSTLYMTPFWPLIVLLGTAFSAFHLLSWTSSFPTTIELYLWRTSALLSVATSIVCMQFEAVYWSWEGIVTLVKLGSPFLYVVCRLIMMAEVFTGLRAMEEEVYETWVGVNYWVHFL